MMKIHYINIVLAAAAVLVGCNTVGPEEALLPLDDISLTIKGEEQFIYSKENFQLGFNDRKIEFRVTEDKLAHWFVLDCNELPTGKGQKIKATLKYTTDTTTKELKDLEFVVQKTSQDGLVWLWNSSRQIGVVVRYSFVLCGDRRWPGHQEHVNKKCGDH